MNETPGDRDARARQDADRATEAALFKSVHDAYIAVAQSSLDRSIQRATFVTTAAGSVVTLYTGLLALRFKADGNVLPARGLLPSLFLGGSVAFSTVYVAFLRRKTVVALLLPGGVGATVAETRLRTFLEWSSAAVAARAWSLRMAVLSLGFGLALLPVPFLALSSLTVKILGGVAGGLLGAWAIGEAIAAAAAPPYAVAPPKPLPPAPPRS